MADISSPVSYTKLNDVEISNDAAVTEALFFKVGQQINKLIDDIGTAQTDITAVEDKNLQSYSTASNTTISGGVSQTLFTINVSSYQNPVNIFIRGRIASAAIISQYVYLRRNGTNIQAFKVGSLLSANFNDSFTQQEDGTNRQQYVGYIVDPTPSVGNNVYSLFCVNDIKLWAPPDDASIGYTTFQAYGYET